jgi:hypothetical protein
MSEIPTTNNHPKERSRKLAYLIEELELNNTEGLTTNVDLKENVLESLSSSRHL